MTSKTIDGRDLGRSLVWIRRDLRVHDHAALYHAAKHSSQGVLAVFAVTPGFWRAHDEAGVKVDFWLRNLRLLKASLGDLGIPLEVLHVARIDALPKALLELGQQHGCSALHFHREYEVNEDRRDRKVRQAWLDADLDVFTYHDRVVLKPGSVLTQEGKPYAVFTPYRKRWSAQVAAEGWHVYPAPEVRERFKLKSTTPVPDVVDGFAPHTPQAETLWPAGEAAAARALEAFVAHRLRRYDADRDTPSIEGTSRLSPYLAAGVLSPRQCLEAVKDAVGPKIFSADQGVSTWVSELTWREFYLHLLADNPRLSKHAPFKTETDKISWRQDEKDFAAWCEGRTGFPIVDAAMRQLQATGWMHNRLRMIVASFLTKDLLIDWRWGERFFMQHLIDGDVAANNGGWQWSASTGTDAQPYFRIFNPTTQGERFDAQGAFIRRYVPELAHVMGKGIHAPHDRGALGASPQYPAPMVDHKAARERTLSAFKAIK